MKKVTKATIAAAAAGVLLLGGAGTVALWSANDDIGAGTVSTGHLTLETTTEGSWTDISSDAATSVFNATTDHLVPGDTIAYNQTVTISADGKNLKGQLTAGGLTGEAGIPAEVTIDVVVDGTDEGLVQEADVITFAEAGSYDVPVTVTVTFDQAAIGTMETDLVLGSMSLELEQIRS